MHLLAMAALMLLLLLLRQSLLIVTYTDQMHLRQPIIERAVYAFTSLT